jgi:transposase
MMTREEQDATVIPDPEVKPVVRQRQYSIEEKRRILAAADACTQPGELGALIRREKIHSSYLSRWRRAEAAGRLSGSNGQKRGPKAPVESALADENATLERENARLRERLATAEMIIEVQKKLSQLLGMESQSPQSSEPA